MYNFRRRKQKTEYNTTSSQSPQSQTAPTSSSLSMCRSTMAAKRKIYPKRKTGILRRPSWGGLVGLGDFRRIEDLDLRESVLPRTPAYLHLTATTRSGNLKRQAEPIVFDDERDNQKNDRWNMEVDACGQPQKKRKKLRFLEELHQGSLSPKETITDSKKWKGLDDLVDLAYKIRVSDNQYDWDKLLEEDIEEDSSDSEKEGTSSESSGKQHEHEEQQMTKQFEKTSIHLH